MRVHAARRPQRTGNEQQRITRQKGRHDQPGFAEYDQEQERINPRTVLLQQHRQVAIKMDDDVPELKHQIHHHIITCRTL